MGGNGSLELDDVWMRIANGEWRMANELASVPLDSQMPERRPVAGFALLRSLFRMDGFAFHQQKENGFPTHQTITAKRRCNVTMMGGILDYLTVTTVTPVSENRSAAGRVR